jgi:hypothetical protein
MEDLNFVVGTRHPIVLELSRFVFTYFPTNLKKFTFKYVPIVTNYLIKIVVGVDDIKELFKAPIKTLFPSLLTYIETPVNIVAEYVWTTTILPIYTAIPFFCFSLTDIFISNFFFIQEWQVRERRERRFERDPQIEWELLVRYRERINFKKKFDELLIIAIYYLRITGNINSEIKFIAPDYNDEYNDEYGERYRYYNPYDYDDYDDYDFTAYR